MTMVGAARWTSPLTCAEVADNTYRDGSANLNNTEDSFVKTGRRVAVDARKA